MLTLIPSPNPNLSPNPNPSPNPSPSPSPNPNPNPDPNPNPNPDPRQAIAHPGGALPTQAAPAPPFGRSASWPTAADGHESFLWAPPADSTQPRPLSGLGPLMVGGGSAGPLRVPPLAP